MTAAVVIVVVAVAIIVLVALSMSVRMVQQYERGIVFRFGRVLDGPRHPGLRFIVPIVDPVKVLVNVRDYEAAVLQVAQTSMRSVIGRTDLDTLLSDRERVNAELKAAIDAPTEQPWGVLIERVEVKDVALPDSMKRSMSRQAEAERERRARVIAADGEFQASRRLADAGRAMGETPGAFQLRLLQTVVDVAAEKNSTLVMPFPVELLRFFDQLTQTNSARPGATADRSE